MSQRLDSNWRTIWTVDAHREEGKRFIVRADEKLTAFLELERVTRESFANARQQLAESTIDWIKPPELCLSAVPGIEEHLSAKRFVTGN